ncbi:hypothetical protein T492DRAFT_1008464 [Pavlovales sp. CCMP2436]|nr:hypothetical protein T492DRAFT_1008464 [Pavlovales sp. CCMP2436]
MHNYSIANNNCSAWQPPRLQARALALSNSVCIQISSASPLLSVTSASPLLSVYVCTISSASPLLSVYVCTISSVSERESPVTHC